MKVIEILFVKRAGVPSHSTSGCLSERLPCSSNGKELAYNAGDQGSIPGLGSSSGEGNGNPFQYSCLENSKDREAWWATVHAVAELDTTELLSDCESTVHIT